MTNKQTHPQTDTTENNSTCTMLLLWPSKPIVNCHCWLCWQHLCVTPMSIKRKWPYSYYYYLYHYHYCMKFILG